MMRKRRGEEEEEKGGRFCFPVFFRFISVPSLSPTHSRVPQKKPAANDHHLQQDTWERDGRTMYKIEVYITNKGQHNMTSLDVVVPKREVVYESWGAAHDLGEDSGRRIFTLPDFIKEKGGITSGECYNFSGVFSEADPGFLVENFDAPS